jgi:transposase
MREYNELLGLPTLRIVKTEHYRKELVFWVKEIRRPESCPRCTKGHLVKYGGSLQEIRDIPFQERGIRIKLLKRRYLCKACRKVFTQQSEGILPRQRMTERFKVHIAKACQRFACLKSVAKVFKLGYSSLYNIYYRFLNKRLQTRLNAWPRVIGLDEHRFKKRQPWNTTVVDQVGKRVFDIVAGKTIRILKEALCSIPGRENVQFVTMDLCEGYRSFSNEMFPGALVIADRFHVQRLFQNEILKYRRKVFPKRNMSYAYLLQTHYSKLTASNKQRVWTLLQNHPLLKELHTYKERLVWIYKRFKSYKRARQYLRGMIDQMKLSSFDVIQKIARTLNRWFEEIVRSVVFPFSNGRVEGFHTKIKLIKRRAYGFRSFPNFKLCVLTSDLI